MMTYLLPSKALIGASIVTYTVFHHYEPDKVRHLVTLLILWPSLVTFLSHSSNLNILSLIQILPCYVLWQAIIVLTLTTLYRLSPFHPLARYPGPFPNRVSKLWMSYICSKGKQHVYYKELHMRHGDIVRIGPNELSINRVDALQPVLNTLPKGPVTNNRDPEGDASNTVSQRDWVEHARRRKPWTRAFTSANLKNFDDIVVKRAKELCHELGSRQNKDVDLAQWFGFFAFDFMGDMAFGANFDMMRKGRDTSGLWEILENGMMVATLLSHASWIFRTLEIIPGADAVRQAMQDLARSWASRRIERGSTIKDLFFHLTDESGEEPVKLTKEEVQSEGLLAIVAGSDTTATTLSVIFCYLIQNPSYLQRLKAEIDSNFPDQAEPADFARLARMPYLNACINEALRLVPPVLSGVQRHVPSGSGGITIGPYFIPEGNQVFVHTWTVHRDEANFSPMPESFWPDRWLPESDRLSLDSKSKAEYIHRTEAFHPFSLGPANCVGRSLAKMEIRAVTCFLLQKFDFQAADGADLASWESKVKDCFVAQRAPLHVVLTTRFGVREWSADISI